MLETCLNQFKEICKEFSFLIEHKIPLYIYFKGQEPRSSLLVEFKGSETDKYLILHKTVPYEIPNEMFLVTYRFKGGLIKGFQTSLYLEENDKFKLHFPKEIIQIQRRKFKRIDLNPKCTVIFTRLNSQHLNSGTITNICLEGACLTGNFTSSISKEDLLSPVTLNLRMERGKLNETIIIPEATVKRVEESIEGEKIFGIHFQLSEKIRARLENFLSLCALIERTQKRKSLNT